MAFFSSKGRKLATPAKCLFQKQKTLLPPQQGLSNLLILKNRLNQPDKKTATKTSATFVSLGFFPFLMSDKIKENAEG
jgi:hypothetical protein